ncbi:MAG: hypothetical protein WC966_10505 [Bradymonadales bacterium]
MRVIVPVQYLVKLEERLILNEMGTSFLCPEGEGAINDYDLASLECALRLREAGQLSCVSAVSLSHSKAALLHALAMGADDAHWLYCEAQPSTAQAATLLIDWLKTQNFDLIMSGRLGLAYESGELSQRIAEALGIACFHDVVELRRDGDRWLVRCEDEGARVEFSFTQRAVISSGLRLAQPRHPSFPSILRAKTKACTVRELALPAGAAALQTLGLRNAAVRKREPKSMSVEDLVRFLGNKR